MNFSDFLKSLCLIIAKGITNNSFCGFFVLDNLKGHNRSPHVPCPIEKLDVKNVVKNGVKNDVKNWDSFLRHFLRQESVVLTSDIEKVCVHVVNNGTECVVPNLCSY